MPTFIMPTARTQYPSNYLLSSFHTHNTHFSHYFPSPTPPFIPHSFLFYPPMCMKVTCMTPQHHFQSFPLKFILYQTHFPLSPTAHSTNNTHTILTPTYSTSFPFNHPSYLTYPSPPPFLFTSTYPAHFLTPIFIPILHAPHAYHHFFNTTKPIFSHYLFHLFYYLLTINFFLILSPVHMTHMHDHFDAWMTFFETLFPKPTNA